VTRTRPLDHLLRSDHRGGQHILFGGAPIRERRRLGCGRRGKSLQRVANGRLRRISLVPRDCREIRLTERITLKNSTSRISRNILSRVTPYAYQ
jgi:hypothetical protein